MEQAGYMTTNIFGQLDENHDGRISQKEFMEVRGLGLDLFQLPALCIANPYNVCFRVQAGP
jgi:hypothetical protein